MELVVLMGVGHRCIWCWCAPHPHICSWWVGGLGLLAQWESIRPQVVPERHPQRFNKRFFCRFWVVGVMDSPPGGGWRECVFFLKKKRVGSQSSGAHEVIFCGWCGRDPHQDAFPMAPIFIQRIRPAPKDFSSWLTPPHLTHLSFYPSVGEVCTTQWAD